MAIFLYNSAPCPLAYPDLYPDHIMPNITLPDGSVRHFDNATNGSEIAASIGKGLARDAGRFFSREQLLEQVWDYAFHGDDRVVDAAIKRLRGKLREADPDAEVIVTVRGVGYKMRYET